jgi:valyl-tRNA synthetase
MKLAKMSKSRGNVVLPEEVVHGVCDLMPGYDFRDTQGRIMNWKLAGIWRHATGYLTSTRTGRQPVFLHEVNNPVPCLLQENMQADMQHPELLDYWQRLLDLYEEKS